jgi:hypothetical protein
MRHIIRRALVNLDLTRHLPFDRCHLMFKLLLSHLVANPSDIAYLVYLYMLSSM